MVPPERIELPSHGSKPRILSIELQGRGVSETMKVTSVFPSDEPLYRAHDDTGARSER